MLLYDMPPMAVASPVAVHAESSAVTGTPLTDGSQATAVNSGEPKSAASTPSAPETGADMGDASVISAPRPSKPKAVKQGDHLLGDWFGLRTDLQDLGITPVIAYTESSLGNVRGGTKSRFDTAGQFKAGLEFDLPKLTGGSVPGTFQVGLVRRHSLAESFSNTSGLTPLVNPLSIQGRGSIWRVSQLWYKVSVGKLNVKLGRMYLNEDFNKENCDFLSGYFCLGEVTRAYSTVWPTSPVSQWGVRLQYALTDRLALKMAVYQYNPKNLAADRPMYIGWKGATGIIAPVELEWKPKVLGGLPGTYALGAYYSNSDQDDPVLNTDHEIRAIAGGSPLVRHTEWGAMSMRASRSSPHERMALTRSPSFSTAPCSHARAPRTAASSPGALPIPA